MASPVLPLLGIAALALAGLSAGGRKGARAVGRVCRLLVDAVSLEDASEQDRWIRCPGRTPEEAQALAGRLTAAGRLERAQAVIALYSRRRAVEDSPPDASTVAPATRAAVERTVTTPDASAATIPMEPHSEALADTPDATPPPPASTSSSTTAPSSTTRHHRRTTHREIPVTPAERSAVDYSIAARAQPSGFSDSAARSAAPDLRHCLRQRSAAQCRRRLRQFQGYAGIPVDGRYGTLTYFALSFYLGGDTTDLPSPPALRSDPHLHYTAPTGAAPADLPPLRPAEPFGSSADVPTYHGSSTTEPA